MPAAKTVNVKLYKGEIEITFNPESQWARYKVNGQPTTGVTSVTGMKDKSGPLMYWAVNCMRDYLLGKFYQGQPITEADILAASKEHQVKKTQAAGIGTRVHEWIEQWTILKGNFSTMPEGSDDDTRKVLNGIIAFLKWIDDNKVKIIESERIVYSREFDFVGTLDAVAKINGKLCMLDYKTSKVFSTEHRYQTAAYQQAYYEEFGVNFDARYILKLGKEDGEFTTAYLPHEEFAGDIGAFLGLLALKKREGQIKNWESVLNMR